MKKAEDIFDGNKFYIYECVDAIMLYARNGKYSKASEYVKAVWDHYIGEDFFNFRKYIYNKEAESFCEAVIYGMAQAIDEKNFELLQESTKGLLEEYFCKEIFDEEDSDDEDIDNIISFPLR